MLVIVNGERQPKRIYCTMLRYVSMLITFWMHLILFTKFRGKLEVGFIFSNANSSAMYVCIHSGFLYNQWG